MSTPAASQLITVVSAPDTSSELRPRFRELADKWHAETDMLSFDSDIQANLNYLRMIALGPRVVPLILEELRARGGHWYVALNALTDAWPVPDDANGFPRRMTEHWLEWGRHAGLLT